MSLLLEARGLQLRRGSAGRQRTVLDRVDCRLAAGEVLMLIGPNGAGKSTLLSALAGDLAPSAGTIHLSGKAIHDWPAPELARHRAMLTQHIQLSLEFTVEEIVGLGAMARGLRAATQATLTDTALRALSLQALRDRRVTSLSGGEQTRVHLARVLAQLWPLPDDAAQPRLLLLDEPCASLDPYYQHQICAVVRDFARSSGAGVILTMHDMNLAAQYGDRMLVLAQGGVLADGDPRTVLHPALVRSCFGVDAARLEHDGRLLLATQALTYTDTRTQPATQKPPTI